MPGIRLPVIKIDSIPVVRFIQIRKRFPKFPVGYACFRRLIRPDTLISTGYFFPGIRRFIFLSARHGAVVAHRTSGGHAEPGQDKKIEQRKQRKPDDNVVIFHSNFPS